MSGIYNKTTFMGRVTAEHQEDDTRVIDGMELLEVAAGRTDDDERGIIQGPQFDLPCFALDENGNDAKEPLQFPVQQAEPEMSLVMQVHNFMLNNKVYMRHDKSLLSGTLKATLVENSIDYDSVVVRAKQHFNAKGIIELDVDGAMAEYQRAMARLVKRYLADRGWQTDDIDTALAEEA